MRLSPTEIKILEWMDAQGGNPITAWDLGKRFDMGTSTPTARLRGLELKGFVRKNGTIRHPERNTNISLYERWDSEPVNAVPRTNKHEPKHSGWRMRHDVGILLRYSGPKTRDTLIRIMGWVGVPPSTVQSAVSDGLMLGLYREEGTAPTRRGRSAALVHFVKEEPRAVHQTPRSRRAGTALQAA